MVNKKGQLKIQQMAFMLIAVTLFFVMVGMFVLIFNYSGMKDEANRLREENALLLVSKVANSPEFSCGASSGTQKTYCIDEDKVMALKKNINLYQDFWGKDTNIVIRKIYPPTTKDKVCELSNYPSCNIINVLGQNVSGEHSNFIALCRKDNINGEVVEKCELAKILVSYKSIA
ncbi:Uncharacterised protein [uncultured archaeon]|nr:Uncharacterised protein [uncultured archaeon]